MSRRNGKFQPKFGGKVNPRDASVPYDDQLLTEIASHGGPIRSIYTGYNAFLTYTLPAMMNDIRITEISSADYFYIQVVADGYLPSNIPTPFQAVQEKSNFRGFLLGHIVVHHKSNGVWSSYSDIEDGKSRQIMELTAMTGSVLDPTANKKDIFDDGNCPYFPKGYTIHNGNLQHTILQTKLRNNLVIIYDDLVEGPSCNMTTMDIRGITTKIVIYDGEKIKSKGKDKSETHIKDMMLNTRLLGKDGTKTNKIPLFYAFSLFGYTTTRSVKKLIMTFIDDEYKDVVESTMAIDKACTESELIAYIKGKFSITSTIDVAEVLRNEIYPNAYVVNDGILDKDATNEKKAMMLAYMAAQFCLYKAGLRPLDSRDSVGFTRVETPEVLLMKLCAIHLVNQYSSIKISPPGAKFNPKTYLSTKKEDIYAHIKEIGEKINEAFAKGTWIGKSAKNNTSGKLAEVLMPDSLLRTWSTMSKNNVASSKKGKQYDSRVANPTQSRYNDTKDCHEGEDIGLKRQFSMCEHTSTNKDKFYVIKILSQYMRNWRDGKTEEAPHPVHVCGIIEGWAYGPELIKEVRELRMKGGPLREYWDMMVCYDNLAQEVQISTDPGRATRPMLVANEQGSDVLLPKYGMTEEEMLDHGYIEYVDSYHCDKACLVSSSREEQYQRWKEISLLQAGIYNGANYFQGVSERLDLEEVPIKRTLEGEELQNFIEKRIRCCTYTHVDVAKSSGDGYAGSQVPGSNHTLGSKACYSCNINGQSIAANNTNFPLNSAANMKVALYRTRCTTETAETKNIGLHVVPKGHELRICINAGPGNGIYGGTNQEDAYTLSRGLVDMAVFNYYSVHQKKYDHLENDRKRIALPKTLDPRYVKLDDRGIIKTGAFVVKGDILIAVQTLNEKGVYVQKDIKLDNIDSGVVDSVLVVEGLSHITINIKEYHQYTTGSKASGCNGTKGVCGSVTEEYNMYRTEDGIVSGYIISSLGYISRQTWPLLREMIMSTVGAHIGKRQNGTSYGDDFELPKYEKVMLRMKESNSYGASQMYNGKTGLPLNDLSYNGRVAILPLHHTPEDKANFVGRKVQRILNNQTNKGASVDGTARFGEMESVAIRAMGAAQFHYSTFAYDNLFMAVCGTCGVFASCNLDGVYRCALCEWEGRNYIIYRCNISGAQRHLAQQAAIQNIMIRHFPKPVVQGAPRREITV